MCVSHMKTRPFYTPMLYISSSLEPQRKSLGSCFMKGKAQTILTLCIQVIFQKPLLLHPFIQYLARLCCGFLSYNLGIAIFKSLFTCNFLEEAAITSEGGCYFLDEPPKLQCVLLGWLKYFSSKTEKSYFLLPWLL